MSFGTRTSALGRFMEAYSQLARLPAPRRQACEIGELVRRAAKLEYRMTIVVEPGFERLVNLDPDQIEQALINLIKNAVDAVTETHGEVHIRWTLDRPQFGNRGRLDEGAGLPNTTNLLFPSLPPSPEVAESDGAQSPDRRSPRGNTDCRKPSEPTRLPCAASDCGVSSLMLRPQGICAVALVDAKSISICSAQSP